MSVDSMSTMLDWVFIQELTHQGALGCEGASLSGLALMLKQCVLEIGAERVTCL